MIARILLLTFVALVLSSLSASAAEPNWTGTVIARGQRRDQILSKEIVHRPYRPLHFYGNSVRRRHYRGTLVPMPSDISRGLTAFVAR